MGRENSHYTYLDLRSEVKGSDFGKGAGARSIILDRPPRIGSLCPEQLDPRVSGCDVLCHTSSVTGALISKLLRASLEKNLWS